MEGSDIDIWNETLSRLAQKYMRANGEICGPGSSVGIVTELRAGRSEDRIPMGARFSTRPDRPWAPPSLLYNRYRVFPGGKVRPGRDADHSPPSRAEVLEE